MTIGSHQKTIGKSQVHITPIEIIRAVGPFGLDPCAASRRPWNCARRNFTRHDNGLKKSWGGAMVWLNPPFHRYQVAAWIKKLAEHGNGVALLHARTETDWFLPCWQKARCILFLADRIKFCKPNGRPQPANSGAPVCLVAFGDKAAGRLRACGLAGVLVDRWQFVEVAT